MRTKLLFVIFILFFIGTLLIIGGLGISFVLKTTTREFLKIYSFNNPSLSSFGLPLILVSFFLLIIYDFIESNTKIIPKESKKRIALFCINKQRDLDGLIFLKIELEKKGHEVKIFNHEDRSVFLKLMRYLPHTIVIGTILDPKIRKYSRIFKEMGSKIIESRAEGIFIKTHEKIQSNKYEDTTFLDAEIVWGENLKKLLLKYSNIPENKIYICGCPRFDIHNKKEFLVSKEEFYKEHNLNKDNKIITFATNFPFADRKGKVLRGTYHKDRDYDLFGFADLQDKERKTIFSTTIKLAKEFKNINFIVKVHPSEVLDFYVENKPKEISNLAIIQNEKIYNIFNITDILIHSNTTTSIEAWFNNLPVICLYYFKNENKDDVYFNPGNKGGDIVKTYQELKEKINYYLDNNPINEEILNFRRNFIDEYLYKVDGNSTKRVTEIINKTTEGTGEITEEFYFTIEIPLRFRLFIRKILKIPNNKSLFGREHKGYFSRVATEEEILEKENYWRKNATT